MAFALLYLIQLVQGGFKDRRRQICQELPKRKVQLCDLCDAKVSLKKMEQHMKLKCQVCGHHHRQHGQLDYCCLCIRRCKKCGPSLSRHMARNIVMQKRPRCDCGHYHVDDRTCNVFAGPSLSALRSISRERYSDSDSTLQSMVI